MSMLKKLAKAGIAKKVVAEARKPQNQQRAKDAWTKLRNRPSTTRPR